MSDQGVPDFRGGGASEVQDFIRALNRIALESGKSQDSRWKAELASTAFSGEALRWFRSLAPKVQVDWDVIQTALLKQYAPDEAIKEYPEAEGDGISLDSTRPTADEARQVIFVRPRTRGSLEGYIRVISDTRSAFINRALNKAGILGTTSTLADALRVKFTPDFNPRNIETLNCTGPFEFWVARIAIRLTDGTSLVPVAQAIWSVLIDGTLIAQVYRDKVWYRLVVAWTPSYLGELYLVSDFDSFVASVPQHQWDQARLKFEPKEAYD